MEILFTPQFIRSFKKLPSRLQEETLEKIELFRDSKSHAQLRVHKLKGRMAGRHSFSVNYRYRIVFNWEANEKTAVLLVIGDHSVYD